MVYTGFFDDPQRPRPSFNAKDKAHLYAEQKGKCNGCAVKFPKRNMTVDHIKAFTKGGSDKPSNLQLLCNSCNSTKGKGTQAALMKRLREQGHINGAAKTTKKAASTKTTVAISPAKKKPPKKQPSDPFADLFGF